MRDIRDPSYLGRWILSRRELNPAATICSIADSAVNAQHPEYSRTESTVDETKALYQQQMLQGAEEGDAAARIVCEEKGWAYTKPKVHVQHGRRRESVSETTERYCYDQMPHRPHVWLRWDGRHAESYTCPGKE